MTKTLAAAAISVLLLTLTACGGGEGSSDDEAASKAISDSIMKEQESGSGDVFTMERKEADCIGDGFVEDIGVDKLQEYGFLTEDLKAEAMTNVTMEPGDAEAATGVLFECADVTQMMSQAMAAGEEVDAATQKCLEDVLTEDKLRSMFTLMFSGKQDQASQEVIAPMMKCAAGSMQ